MQKLLQTLTEYDLELLQVIANRWDVDLSARDAKQAAEQLSAAMLKPEKVAEVWARLEDAHRGALQALIGAGGKMAMAMFGRMFGEIRQMGPDRIVREKPHLDPASAAEALYYRGLLAMTFAEADTDKEKTGEKGKGKGKAKEAAKARPTVAVVYVPTDLMPLMPTTDTALKREIDKQSAPPVVPPAPEPETIRQADTTIIDDLTTILAACQVEDVPFGADGAMDSEYRTALKPYTLGSNTAVRFHLMTGLAIDMGIAGLSGEGTQILKPIAQKARGWMDGTRPAQIRALAEAWRSSVTFNELMYVPNLKIERVSNDPLLARQTVLSFLEQVPPNGWWPISELIEAVKEEEPDFQRPDGDYESWYIRDAQSGEYLRGFEKSWDKVDGALLRFILIGPLYGLGLLDLSGDLTLCRLTAYGRAFVDRADWPANVPNEGLPVKVLADGTCEVPRGANRYERFQLARFTQWLSAGEPYRYKINADGLETAKRQGFKAEMLITFLRRVTDNALPENVIRQIELWRQQNEGGAVEAATISRVMVLRLPRPEMLDALMKEPSLRKYLGATLGPAAAIVRPGQWEALLTALRESGMAVEADLDGE